MANQPISRRSVLGGIGGTISVGAITTVGAAESSEKIEIVTHKSGDTPIKKQEVPKAWWDYENKAINLHDRLQEKYRESSGIESVSVGARSKRIAGRKMAEVIVDVDPEEGTDENVPERKNGVRIRKRDYNPGSLQCVENRCNTDPYDPVPGGVALENGSCTCRVNVDNPDEGPWMLTAAHVIKACENFGDERVQQGRDADADEDQKNPDHPIDDLGDVRQYDLAEDWAAVKHGPNSEKSFGFSGDIRGEGSVQGHVTESGLWDLKSKGTPVFEKGYKTCRTKGPITELYYQSEVGCHDSGAKGDDYVKYDICTKIGDSGGPVFDEIDSDIVGHTYPIIATHSGGSGIGGFYGYATYDLHNKYGLLFG